MYYTFSNTAFDAINRLAVIAKTSTLDKEGKRKVCSNESDWLVFIYFISYTIFIGRKHTGLKMSHKRLSENIVQNEEIYQATIKQLKIQSEKPNKAIRI